MISRFQRVLAPMLVAAAVAAAAACSGDTGEEGSAETASERIVPNVEGTDPTGGVGNNPPQSDPGINVTQQQPGAAGDTGAASPRLDATGRADQNAPDTARAPRDTSPAGADTALPR